RSRPSERLPCTLFKAYVIRQPCRSRTSSEFESSDKKTEHDFSFGGVVHFHGDRLDIGSLRCPGGRSPHGEHACRPKGRALPPGGPRKSSNYPHSRLRFRPPLPGWRARARRVTARTWRASPSAQASSLACP